MLLAALAVGCERNPYYYCQAPKSCDFLRSGGAPPQAQEKESKAVVVVPGKIAIWQGHSCGESAEKTIVRFDESIDTPDFVTQATVILDGWRLQIMGDHDVRPVGMGTVIDEVGLANGKLSWKAFGGIADLSVDDPYRSCYYYTAVGWNEAAIQAQVHELPAPCPERHGAPCGLAIYPSSLEHPPFAASSAVAVVPHGFAYLRNERELLQIAHDLDHGEPLGWPSFPAPLDPLLYEPNFPSRPETVFDAGRVSWETSHIFQDDDPMRDDRLCVADFVSVIGGAGVGVVQPPFSIQPLQGGGSGGCITSGAGVEDHQDFVLSGLPFAFAIPMLTGWSLAYDCSDDYVAEAGIWLERDFRYERTAPDPGTLRVRVSSILRNKDDAQGFDTRARVSVLGFQTVLGPPDLVVEQQAPNFCTRDAQGQLRIRVRNDGESPVNVGTTTRVSFQVMSTVVTQDVATPPIQPGQGVDLPPVAMPGRCFSPSCTFAIAVDAGSLVDEGAGEGNNLQPGLCP